MRSFVRTGRARSGRFYVSIRFAQYSLVTTQTCDGTVERLVLEVVSIVRGYFQVRQSATGWPSSSSGSRR